ncbi:hypothetical protein [Franzmannia qiaohouensis]|uniref:Uncharacterized protein n=1 Tax=Franzmannia qiaohouensis TaxID=1329370 RepID=A0ABU1HLD8_9GAMM|nr:hypothetical protein [Halomonas qiaohouensis]MDR5907395.1 hypothetical protein [Halomonas qiaohouensis]
MAVAGGLSLNWMRTNVEAVVEEATLDAGGDVRLQATDDLTMNAFTVGGAGAGAVALAGYFAYNYIGGNPDDPTAETPNRLRAVIQGENARVTSAGDVSLLAKSESSINAYTLGASVAGVAALSGTVSLNFTRKDIRAEVKDATVIADGNILIQALDKSRIDSVSAQLNVAIKGGAAGLSVAYHDIQNSIVAGSQNATLETTEGNGGGIIILADSRSSNWAVLAGVSYGTFGAGAGITASSVIDNLAQARIDGGNVTADGNLVVHADTYDTSSIKLGAVAIGAVAIGGSVGVDLMGSDSEAWIGGGAVVLARGNASERNVALSWRGVESEIGGDDDEGRDRNVNWGEGEWDTEGRNGVVVLATSRMEFLTVAVAVAGGVTGAVAANVTVDGINGHTQAWIDNAEVTSNADVVVRALHHAEADSGGGSAAIDLTAAATAGVDVNLFGHQTHAWIDGSDFADGEVMVKANGELAVDALASVNFLSVVIGASIGGAGVAASGSATAVSLALDTRAYVENVRLQAQDIRVSADNQITGRFIAGAAAGSGGVGIGASLAVGLLNSTATAEVLGATLNATQDIDVVANQRMDMGVTVATGAAGLGAVAGAVSVMMADAVTVARVASSLDGRHSVLDAGRDIDVNATTTTLLNQRSSPADYLQAVGAAAVGGAGAGAAVDVMVLREQTRATVGDNARLTAGRDLDVQAELNRVLNSSAVAFSATAALSISGAISVISLGDGLSEENMEEVEELGALVDSSFSDFGDGSYAMQEESSEGDSGVDDENGFDEDEQGQLDDDFDTPSDAGNQNQSNRESTNKALEDLTFDIDFDVEAGQTVGDTAATVGRDAILSAGGDIGVEALEVLNVEIVSGGVAVSGAGSVGISIAVLELNGAVTATVGYGSSLTAGGDIRVTSHAELNSNLHAVGGAADLFISVGGQSTIILDRTVQQASLENAASPADAINIRTPESVMVSASADRDHQALAAGGAISSVAVGVSVGVVEISGATQAWIGEHAVLGDDGDLTNAVLLNDVTVSAASIDRVDLTVVAVAAGLTGAGTANVSTVSLSNQVEAWVGSGVTLTALGDVVISALHTPRVSVESLGVAVSAGVGIGASVVNATLGSQVVAQLGTPGSADSDISLRATNLSVAAGSVLLDGAPSLYAEAIGSAGGALLGINATVVNLRDNASAEALIGDTQTTREAFGDSDNNLVVLGHLRVASDLRTSLEGKALSVVGGLVAAGAAVVDIRHNVQSRARIGDGHLIGAERVSVAAVGHQQAELDTLAGSGGVAAGAGASNRLTQTATTTATLGASTLSVSASPGSEDTDAGLVLVRADQTFELESRILAAAGGVLAGAGAEATYHLSADTMAEVASGAVVTADTLDMLADSTVIRDRLAGAEDDTIRGVAGGAVAGAGAASDALFDLDTRVEVGQGASLATTQGDLRLEAFNDITFYEQINLTAGGLASGAGLTANLRDDDMAASVLIHDNAVLLSAGELVATARGTADISAVLLMDTYGAATVGVGDAKVILSPTNRIVMAEGVSATAFGDINFAAGGDVRGNRDQYALNASLDSFAGSLIPINNLNAQAEMDQTHRIDIQSGAELVGARDVTLFTERFGFSDMNAQAKGVSWVSAVGDAIDAALGSDGGSEILDGDISTNSYGHVTIDGKVQTGIDRELSLVLEMTNVQDEAFDINNELDRLRGELQPLLADSQALLVERAGLRNDLALLETQLGEFEEALEQLEDRLTELETAQAELEEDKSQREDDLANLQADREALVEERDVLDEDDPDNSSEIDDLNARIEQKDQDIAAKQDAIADVQADIDDKQNEIDAQQILVDDKLGEIAAKEGEISDKNEAIDAKQDEVDAKQAKVDDKQAAISAEEDKLDDLFSGGAGDFLQAREGYDDIGFSVGYSRAQTELIDELRDLRDRYSLYRNAGNAELVSFYESEIDRLEQRLVEDGFGEMQSDGTLVINEVDQLTVFIDDVWAQAGTVYVFADDLTGSGEVDAPGDASITILNTAPSRMVMGSTEIPQVVGGLYLNLTEVGDAEAITDLNDSLGAGITGLNPVGSEGATPRITVVNSYGVVFDEDGGTESQVLNALERGLGLEGMSNAERDAFLYDSNAYDSSPASSILYSAEGITRNVSGEIVSYAEGSLEIEGEFRAANLVLSSDGEISVRGLSQFNPGGNPDAQAVSVDGGDGRLSDGALDAVENSRGTAPNISAGVIVIDAEYVNLNGYIRAGEDSYQMVIGDADAQVIADHIASDSNSRILLTNASSGTSLAYYNPRTGQIEVEDIAIDGGRLDITGHVINTGNGLLEVLGGYGTIEVINNTDYTLAVGSLDVSRPGEGYLRIDDTYTGLHEYHYDANGGNTYTFKPQHDARYGFSVSADKTERRYAVAGSSSWAGISAFAADPETLNWGDTETSDGELQDALSYFYRNSGESGYEYSKTSMAPPDGEEDAGEWSELQMVDKWSESTWYGKKTNYAKFAQEKQSVVLHTHSVQANRDVEINFIGNQTGTLNVESQGDVVLIGDLANHNGTTSVTSGGEIRQSDDQRRDIRISGAEVVLRAEDGIGAGRAIELHNRLGLEAASAPPLRLDATTVRGSLSVNQLNGDIVVDRAHAAGDVSLTAAGSLLTGSLRGDADSHVQGRNISLLSEGSIGAGSANPLLIHQSGDGRLNAEARGDIALHQVSGDLGVERVTSSQGDVWLKVDGDLLDRNDDSRRDERTVEQLQGVWDRMGLIPGEDGGRIAEAKEELKQRKANEYQTYWNYRFATSEDVISGLEDGKTYHVKAIDEDGNILLGVEIEIEGEDNPLSEVVLSAPDIDADDPRAQHRLINEDGDAFTFDSLADITGDGLVAAGAGLAVGQSLTYRRAVEYDEHQGVILSDSERAAYREALLELEPELADDQAALEARIDGIAEDRTSVYRQLHEVYGVEDDGSTSELRELDYQASLTAAEEADIEASVKEWTEQELLSLIGAGLLQETTSTRTEIQAPNVDAAGDITLIAGGNIGVANGREVLDMEGGLAGLSEEERLLLSAAERQDVSYLKHAPQDANVNFVVGDTEDGLTTVSLNLTNGDDWDTQWFKPGETLDIDGRSLNFTENGLYYDIVSVDGGTMVLETALDVVAESGVDISLATVLLDPRDPDIPLEFDANGDPINIIKFISISLVEDLNINNGGEVFVEAGGSVYLGADAEEGEASVRLAKLEAGADARIKVSGSILAAQTLSGDLVLRSGDLILEAANGQIGSDAEAPLQLDLRDGATVTARAQDGIFLRALDSDLRVGTMFSQGGDVWLRADGSIVDGLNHDLINMLANNITLIAGDDIGSAGNFLEFATRPGGVVDAQADGDIYLDTVDGSMAIGYIEAGEHAHLRALQSIIGSNANELAGDVKATTLRLDTRIGGVGEANRLLAIMTDDDEGRLDIDAANSVFVREVLGAAELDRQGDLRLGQVKAGSDNTIALIFSEQGSILNALEDGEGENILTFGVRLIAEQNVGTEAKVITTRMGVLEGESRQGVVYLENSGALEIAESGMLAENDINITANSPIHVTEDVQSRSGDVTFKANAGDEDIVTFSNGVQVHANEGSVLVYAAEGIVIDHPGVLISATDNVEFHLQRPESGDPGSTSGFAKLATGTIEAGDTFLMQGGDSRGQSWTLGGDLTVNAPLIRAVSGEGDNTFVLGGTMTAPRFELHGGSGNDSITFNGEHRLDEAVIELGNGENHLTLGGAIKADALTVLGGQDDDHVTFDGNHRIADRLEVQLGEGNDTLRVHGTIDATGGSMRFDGNAGDDDLMLHADQLLGAIELLGGGGDNLLTVVELNDRDELLTLDGGAGSDVYRIITRQDASTNYEITVADSGAINDGVDYLFIEGRGYDGYDGSVSADDLSDVGNDAQDLFLIRSNFIARMEGDGDTGVVEGAAVERINYDDTMNGRVTVNGHEGNDVFVVDDTSALMTLDGGAGNDRFQIGQIFTDDPNATDEHGNYLSGIRGPEDEINVTSTTLGYLSYGNSEALVIYGGDGDDEFIVYSNKALLRMEGEDGNDDFIIRAFIAEDDIEIFGGGGDDNIEYNINAPVSIDGGSGYNTITVLGTERSDNFVITEDGVFGAGLNIGFDNIQRLRVDALEGDDTFFVLSTSPDVVTELIGGVGSSSFVIGGDVTGRVVSADPEGRSSLVTHTIRSGDEAYDSLLGDGLSVTVADPSRGAVVVEEPNGGTSVVQGGPASFFNLSLALPMDDDFIGATVTLTVSAAMASTNLRNKSADAETVRLALGEDGDYRQAITVDFEYRDDQGWVAVDGNGDVQSIYVKAPEDSLVSGTREVTVSYLARAQMDDGGELPEALKVLEQQAISNTMVTVYDSSQGDLVFGLPNGDRLQVIEGDDVGAPGSSFELRLSSAPEAGETVTVKLDLDERLRAQLADGTSLDNGIEFTDQNWDQPLTIQLQAVDDSEVQNRLDTRIGFTAESNKGSDSNFDGVEFGTVRVSVYDNDSPSLVVQQTDGSTRVTTEGGTDSYFLRLSKQPAEKVTVRLNSDGLTAFDWHDNARIIFESVLEEAVGVTAMPGAHAGPRLVLEDSDWQDLDLNVGMYLTLQDEDGETLDGTFRVNNVEDGTLHLTGEAHIDFNGEDAKQLTVTRVEAPAVVFDTDNWNQRVEIGLRADTHFVAAENTLNDMNFEPQPNLLDRIQGPLILEGGTSDTDRSLNEAIMLPYEREAYIERDDDESAVDEVAPENEDTNTLTLHADASMADLSGVLTSTFLSGLGMGEGDALEQRYTNALGEDITITTERGIQYHGFSVVELLLGSGNNELLIDLDKDAVIHDGDYALRDNSVGNAVLSREDASSWYADGFRRGDTLLMGDQRVDILDINIDGDLVLNRPMADLPKTASRIIREMPITVVHGGGNSELADGSVGGDHITVTGGYDAQLPLFVFGNTERSGERYSATGGPSALAQQFDLAGNNVLDASGATGGVVLVGGSGNDTLIGGSGNDQLFGGGGNNRLDASAGGNNHLYGNGSIDVDLSARLGQAERIMTLYSAESDVPHGTGDRLVAGDNSLMGGDGNDILIGDHGVIELEARDGTAGLRLLDSQRVVSVRSTDPGNVGNNQLSVSAGDNLLLGGGGNNVLTGSAGNDVLIGDHGDIVLASVNDPRRLTSVTTRADVTAGDNTLSAGEGDNVILGGEGSNTITAGDGNNLIAGDHADARFNAESVIVSFTSTFIGRGGDDSITTGTGNDWIIGGQGNDDITVAGGDNVVVGDHGRILAPAAIVTRAESLVTASPSGGDNAIRVGHGDDVILGGEGNNDITSDGGHNLIAGDLAEMRFDSEGVIVSFTSTFIGRGGDDTIITGIGNDWIIGGQGDDDITVAGGDNVVIGDNGRIQPVNGVRSIVESLDVSNATGGNNTIEVGAGRDQIIGGVGNDAITNAAGDSVIIGDVGRIDSDASGRYRVVETGDTRLGGNNRINGGSDRDVIFGGRGDDVIHAGEGDNVIAGDHAKASFNEQGVILSFTSLDIGSGGSDTISAGSGTDWIIGGQGDDDITVAGGDNVVIGDNGRIQPLNGVRSIVESLDVSNASGGNNTIAVGAGRDQIIGGVGNDVVTNVAGETVIIGDVGCIESDAAGRYVLAETGDTRLGGNNELNGGSDRDIMFGGRGDDILRGGDGDDILFGDFGKVTRSDTLITVESTDFFEGGNDELYLGGGRNIAIGGAGNDGFDGGFDNDTMIGEYARIRIELGGAREDVVSVVTLAQGRLDLIRQAQQDLYTDDEPTGESARSWLDATPGNLIGADASMIERDMPQRAATGMAGLRQLIDDWVSQQQGAGTSGSSSQAGAATTAVSPAAADAAPASDAQQDEGTVDEVDDMPVEAADEAPVVDAETPDVDDDVAIDEAPQADDELEQDAVAAAGLVAALASSTGWAMAKTQRSASDTRIDTLRREQAANDWQRMSDQSDED